MPKRTSPRRTVFRPPEDPQAPKQETGFSASYIEFAKTLRTWFVAYGIGAPILVHNQESLRAALRAAPDADRIVWCFLGGVLLQITAALTYKIAMWYLYVGELYPTFRSTRRYRVSDWISVALWLELLFDLGTILLFARATLRMMAIFTT